MLLPERASIRFFLYNFVAISQIACPFSVWPPSARRRELAPSVKGGRGLTSYEKIPPFVGCFSGVLLLAVCLEEEGILQYRANQVWHFYITIPRFPKRCLRFWVLPELLSGKSPIRPSFNFVEVSPSVKGGSGPTNSCQVSHSVQEILGTPGIVSPVFFGSSKVNF